MPRAPQHAYSSFLVAVPEEQESSPLGPSGSREEAAGIHANDPFPVELDIGGDGPLFPDVNLFEFEELPTHPVIEEQATITDPIDVVIPDEPKGDDADLLYRIRGLYRLLDLISEQGSGGAGMIKVP